MKEGWDGIAGIEAGEAAKRQASEAEDRLAGSLAFAYLEAFSSDAGRRVLADLRAMTVEREMLPETIKHGYPVTSEQLVPFVAFREGQNQIIKWIESAMKRATEGV